jgi:rRNA-processing protein FCF1
MPNKHADLDYIIPNYKIFIDTCSLMHEHAEKVFLHTLSHFLKKYRLKIFIPKTVIHEIEKKKLTADNDIRRKADTAYKIVENYYANRLVKIQQDKNEPFADNLFQYVFTKFMTKYNLCLITNDNCLAYDILELKNKCSINHIKDIIVLRITLKGELQHHDYNYLKREMKL